MDAIRLFTIPVTKLWVPETAALKQQLLPEILRRYEASDGGGERPGSPHTDDLLSPLPAAYGRLVAECVRSEHFRVRAWPSVHWKHQEYEAQHHEIPSHLTLVHFLSFDRGQHAPPVVYDPARAIKAYCRHDAVPHEFWSEGEAMEVHEGDALILPSYLEQRVAPGTYTKPRVTVSIALTLKEAG